MSTKAKLSVFLAVNIILCVGFMTAGIIVSSPWFGFAAGANLMAALVVSDALWDWIS